MSLEHYFLRSPSAPAPERWREAFANGQVLDAPALQSCLRERAPTQCMVWLSSADAHWSLYLRQILQNQPGARVVLLSGMPEPMEGLKALNAGVRAYTHAYAVPALLQEVALVVAHGGLWVGPDLLQRLVGSTSQALARRTAPEQSPVSDAEVATAPVSNVWATLSAREAQVARAVAAGRSNKEVADLLFISERTVKAHLGAVFEKLGVRDRLQLVLRLAASVESAPISATGTTA
jgi:two-component system nitrate/nitrite response regulator NarL